MEKLTSEERDELRYLKYFYDAVEDALGPASDDVYDSIAENYDGVVPKSYAAEDEEEDDE